MGHIVRCTALADMLKNDFEIVFILQETDEQVLEIIKKTTENIIILPETTDYNSDFQNLFKHLNTGDMVVLDGYNFNKDYQQGIKKTGLKLVYIDDLIAEHQIADVVINQTNDIAKSQYSKESYTQLFLGLKYALLRKPFLKSSLPRKIHKIEKIFLSMGAADIHNITQKFVEALIHISEVKEINLMLGVVNPHLESINKLIEQNQQINIIKHFNIDADNLYQLLDRCDLAICPASSVLLESCAVGIGLVSGFTANNQLDNLIGLEKLNVLINLGDLISISKESIKKKLEDIINRPEIFNDLAINQKKVIDGNSAERILNIFKNLISDKLYFRVANSSDSELYFNWANDPVVRLNSFNQNEISFEDHNKWFSNKLNSPDCFFYLFVDLISNKPVGQVRIDKSGSEVVIGISIDEHFRGKSLGIEMLTKASSDYLERFPDATIVAYIKIENLPSYNLFKKAGFGGEEFSDYNGSRIYKMYKN